MEEFLDKKKRHVFLCYTREDRVFSRKITEELRRARPDIPYADVELLPGDTVAKRIAKVVTAGDYVFLILSKNFLRSKWVSSKVFEAQLDELTTRDVAIVPVLIDYHRVPDFLSKFQMINLQRQTEDKIRELTFRIANATRIDFSSFTGYLFQKIVVALLKKLRFAKVRMEQGTRERGVDITAEFAQRDPFGVRTRERWIVETKLYSRERASVQALRQLMGSLFEFPDAKALLVTNGILTSKAKDWLRGVQRTEKVHVRVIEGPELRSLLLRFPDIVHEYFQPIS